MSSPLSFSPIQSLKSKKKGYYMAWIERTPAAREIESRAKGGHEGTDDED
jgi:hypothetical protein